MASTQGRQGLMRQLARWHIWLGWLVGVPILMWTLTGLFMVAKPIDEVRGTKLRVDMAPQPLDLSGNGPQGGPIREMRSFMQRGRAVTLVTRMDGSVQRYDLATGQAIAPLGASEARAMVAREIVGGSAVDRATLFEADEVPFDFRRPMPVWQITLSDGTHVYVGRETGEIEAVRTRWWRVFDVMWGLHIMDLEAREDTSHPVLILFAALASFGALLGCILMFRRRQARLAA